LARILTPEDFCIVVLSVVIFSVFELETHFRPSILVVQYKENLNKDYYNSVFTFSILQSLFVFIRIMILNAYIDNIFSVNFPKVIQPFFALKLLIEACKNPWANEFLKNLNYMIDAVITNSPKIIGVLVSLGCACFIWRDWRALISGLLVEEVVCVILTYIVPQCAQAFLWVKYEPSFQEVYR
jgi:PST family polysaccharide transporter